MWSAQQPTQARAADGASRQLRFSQGGAIRARDLGTAFLLRGPFDAPRHTSWCTPFPPPWLALDAVRSLARLVAALQGLCILGVALSAASSAAWCAPQTASTLAACGGRPARAMGRCLVAAVQRGGAACGAASRAVQVRRPRLPARQPRPLDGPAPWQCCWRWWWGSARRPRAQAGRLLAADSALSGLAGMARPMAGARAGAACAARPRRHRGAHRSCAPSGALRRQPGTRAERLVGGAAACGVATAYRSGGRMGTARLPGSRCVNAAAAEGGRQALRWQEACAPASSAAWKGATLACMWRWPWVGRSCLLNLRLLGVNCRPRWSGSTCCIENQ